MVLMPLPFPIFTVGFGIFLVVAAFHLRSSSHELIEEYNSTLSLRRHNREFCLNNCTREKHHPNCLHGHEDCYWDHASDQLALLNYNPLLDSDDLGFTHYHIKYQQLRENNVTIEEAETMMGHLENQLFGYPNTWISLSTVVIIFTIIQIFAVCLAFGIFLCRTETPIGVVVTSWISIYSMSLMSLVILCIFSIIWKGNYSCPGLKYQSKYGDNGRGECEASTFGKAFVGAMGGNLLVSAIATGFLTWEMKKGDYKSY